MAIQGTQILDGIFINNGQITRQERDMSIDALNDLSNPSGWQQIGSNSPYSINYITTSSVSNSFYQTFSGGSYILSGLVASNPASGAHNANVLESGLTGFQSNVLLIPPGTYYISRPLNSGLLDTIKHCYIMGYSADSAWQLHEYGQTPDRRGSALVFQQTNSGDIAMFFPCSTATGVSVMNGPYIFENFRIQVATGSLMQIGNGAYLNLGGTAIQTRGIKLNNMSLSCYPQNFTASSYFFSGGTAGDRNRVLGNRPKIFCFRGMGCYDMVIQNTSVYAAYYGIDLYECDFPYVDNVHAGHQAICFRHTTRNNFVSVHGTWNRLFVEAAQGAAIMLDRGSVSNSRVELGYGFDVGEYGFPTGITWNYTTGNLGAIQFAGFTGGRTIENYLIEYIPFKIKDTVTNRSYWLTPTGFVGGTGVKFLNGSWSSYINRNITGNGNNAWRYYGLHFAMSQNTNLLNTSVGLNEAHDNLPVGTWTPAGQRSSVYGLTSNSIGNYTTGNQAVVVGHSRGAQHVLSVGVDWFGGDNINAPYESPLADIHGVTQNNSNYAPYVTNGQVRTSIPDRVWVASRGQGIGAWNSNGLYTEITKWNGRFVEDFKQAAYDATQCHRVQYLYGLTPAPSIDFGYYVRAISASGVSYNLNFTVRNNATAGSTNFTPNLSIGTGWTVATGSFTTTLFGDNVSYPIIHWRTTGHILIDEIVVKRLDSGETFSL